MTRICVPMLMYVFLNMPAVHAIYGLAVKRIVVSSKHSDHSGTSPASFLVCTGFLTMEVVPVECESGHLPHVPRLRMNGVIPPLPPVVSWHVQGQLYFIFQGLKTVLFTLALLYDMYK
jgi:hypothetical protein